MQLTELRRYALAQGWAIAEEYVDTGFSGKIADRPALKTCMSDARRRKFDILLVWKLDRWGRTVAQLSTDILGLDSAGVRFICPSQGIDTDKNNSMSRLLINVLSAFAQFEHDVIAERVAAGSRQYLADYEAGKIGRTKHSKSGKDLAPWRPRKIFNRDRVKELRDAGKSWNQIVAETGLSKTTIRRSLAAAE
jgi:putative DNA-invertase from lambdoid prophage Rac